MIHQKVLRTEPEIRAKTELGYREIAYWSPEVTRQSTKEFAISKQTSLRFNYFCRAALYALLRAIAEAYEKF